MEQLTSYILTATKWALPAVALWVLARCVRSMLREGFEPEYWGRLSIRGQDPLPLEHWECIVGSAKSSDVVLDAPDVHRTHAALIRSDRGQWRLYDLSGGDTSCAGERDSGKGLPVQDGDSLVFGKQKLRFHDLDEKQRAEAEALRRMPGLNISQGLTLLLLTIFQLLMAAEFTQIHSGWLVVRTGLGFAFLILIEWCWFLLVRAMDRRGFEVETLAFFLCTLGYAVCVSAAPEDLLKELLLMLAGLLFFVFLGWWLRDLRRVKALRIPVALLAVALLAVNVALGSTSYGASNWLRLGGISVQPSEFVKIAYIYVGAASLDRLFKRRNLIFFIGFSALCVGALALMGDFGTALIFFVTFLVISFLRSGSFATVFLAVSGAGLAGVLVLSVKPYIAQRFAAWGHVWEDPYGAGWQQTRALSAAASGGLTGVGAGNGWLKDIFAADTDMVFCMVSEEFGLIVAICAVLAVVVIVVFAVRAASLGRSTYFVIAAVASGVMLVVQLALNVFGSTDILPFTGVTFPFVSKGGSSLISCWALLAFIKASDTRLNASFSVRQARREQPAPKPRPSGETPAPKKRKGRGEASG